MIVPEIVADDSEILVPLIATPDSSYSISQPNFKYENSLAPAIYA